MSNRLGRNPFEPRTKQKTKQKPNPAKKPQPAKPTKSPAEKRAAKARIVKGINRGLFWNSIVRFALTLWKIFI